MRFIPISNNDPQSINIALEEIFKNQESLTQKIDELKKEIETKEVDEVVSVGSLESESEEEQDEATEEQPLSIGPSMAGYNPLVSPMMFGRIVVRWHTWPGYGDEEVVDYDIFASIEATCTISDNNKVGSNIKSSPFVISDLTKGQTYDVRIRANGVNGAGAPSN